MKRSSCAGCIGIALVALAGCSPEADIHNPALTPVVEKAKPAGEPMAFVREGALRFCIVADGKMETKRLGNSRPNSIPTALGLLNEAFEHCCGAKPTVCDPTATNVWSKADYVIALGDQPFAREAGVDVSKLPLEGFAVKTFGEKLKLRVGVGGEGGKLKGGIILAGKDSSMIKGWNWGATEYKGASLGTVWAALDFIERFLGVRYYFPGEWGTIWPERKNLVIRPVHYEDAPHFRQRHTQYCFWREFAGKGRKELWEKYLGRGVSQNAAGLRWRAGGTDPDFGMHAPDSEPMAKAYPDRLDKIFYKTPNGKLVYRRGSNIGSYFDCFGDGFIDAYVESCKVWYESKGKTRKGLGGSYFNDTWANFGVCDTMLDPQDYMSDPIVRTNRLVTAADFKRASETDDRAIMANVYGYFYQRLAKRMQKELPGKKLGVMAYYNARNAPTDPRFIPLPENVDVCVCDGGLLSFVPDPKARAKSKKLFHEWRVALGGRPAERMWLYSSGDPLAAGITPEYLGEVIRLLGEDFGRGGVFFDYETKGMWFLYWGYYVYAKCSWNPDLDVDACLAEMWHLLYPHAGDTLTEFHQKLKRACATHLMRFGGDKAFTFAEIDELEALLKKAEGEVRGGKDEIEWKRFLILKDWFEPALKDRRAKEEKRAAGAKVKEEAQADVDPNRAADADFGHLEDDVFTISKNSPGGFSMIFANDVISYNASAGRYKGRIHMPDLSNVFDNHGFSGYARWLDFSVNGDGWVEKGEVGPQNVKAWHAGKKHGYEMSFALGGTTGKLRLYLTPGCDRLQGELAFDDPSAVKSATLRLAAMPSHNSRSKQARPYYWRQVRTAKRELYPAKDEPGDYKNYTLNEDEDWVILQDGNFDGSAEGKGIGPCCAWFDRAAASKVDVAIGLNGRNNWKHITVTATLKPSAKPFGFSVWQLPESRHSNREVFEKLTR